MRLKQYFDHIGLLELLEDCRDEEEVINLLKRENLWGGVVDHPELEALKESYKNGEIETDGTLSLSQLDMVAGGGKGKVIKVKVPYRPVPHNQTANVNLPKPQTSVSSFDALNVEESECKGVTEDLSEEQTDNLPYALDLATVSYKPQVEGTVDESNYYSGRDVNDSTYHSDTESEFSALATASVKDQKLVNISEDDSTYYSDTESEFPASATASVKDQTLVNINKGNKYSEINESEFSDSEDEFTYYSDTESEFSASATASVKDQTLININEENKYSEMSKYDFSASENEEANDDSAQKQSRVIRNVKNIKVDESEFSDLEDESKNHDATSVEGQTLFNVSKENESENENFLSLDPTSSDNTPPNGLIEAAEEMGVNLLSIDMTANTFPSKNKPVNYDIEQISEDDARYHCTSYKSFFATYSQIFMAKKEDIACDRNKNRCFDNCCHALRYATNLSSEKARNIACRAFENAQTVEQLSELKSAVYFFTSDNHTQDNSSLVSFYNELREYHDYVGINLHDYVNKSASDLAFIALKDRFSLYTSSSDLAFAMKEDMEKMLDDKVYENLVEARTRYNVNINSKGISFKTRCNDDPVFLCNEIKYLELVLNIAADMLNFAHTEYRANTLLLRAAIECIINFLKSHNGSNPLSFWIDDNNKKIPFQKDEQLIIGKVSDENTFIKNLKPFIGQNNLLLAVLDYHSGESFKSVVDDNDFDQNEIAIFLNLVAKEDSPLVSNINKWAHDLNETKKLKDEASKSADKNKFVKIFLNNNGSHSTANQLYALTQVLLSHNSNLSEDEEREFRELSEKLNTHYSSRWIGSVPSLTSEEEKRYNELLEKGKQNYCEQPSQITRSTRKLLEKTAIKLNISKSDIEMNTRASYKGRCFWLARFFGTNEYNRAKAKAISKCSKDCCTNSNDINALCENNSELKNTIYGSAYTLFHQDKYDDDQNKLIEKQIQEQRWFEQQRMNDSRYAHMVFGKI